jgi:hypothetical protein
MSTKSKTAVSGKKETFLAKQRSVFIAWPIEFAIP